MTTYTERELERISTLSLLDDEIEVLTNAESSFDVQDGIALQGFRKRLIAMWRVMDSNIARAAIEAKEKP